MPVSQELQGIVDLLGEHDARYQDMAVKRLARILDMAEQAIADSHLSASERMVVQHERALVHHERRFGKAKADAMRKRWEAIRRGDFDDLDE